MSYEKKEENNHISINIFAATTFTTRRTNAHSTIFYLTKTKTNSWKQSAVESVVPKGVCQFFVVCY